MQVVQDQLIGTLISGQYRIESLLGEGAMGVVYRGQRLKDQVAVAIKTLQPSAFHSPKARERFQREAALASKLQHSAIAQVYDYGIEGSSPFLVMELVDGIELSDVITNESPLRPARAIEILKQLIAGLKEAHSKNLIHRDIKPANVRLLHYVAGGPIVLKILDFGIAKEIGEEKGKLTSTGAIMGTPIYLAPEQAADDGSTVDQRVDQYAAGIVLYELLTGHPPFAGQTVASILLSHLTKPPPPLPKSVPTSLQRVVMRMLSKSPSERFADDEALLKAIAACEKECKNAVAAPRVDGLPKAANASLTMRLQQPQTVIGLIGVALLGLLAGAAIYHRVKSKAGTGAVAGKTEPAHAPLANPPPTSPVPPVAPPQPPTTVAPTAPTPPVEATAPAGIAGTKPPKPQKGGSDAGKKQRGKRLQTVESPPPEKPTKDLYDVQVAR